MNIKELREQISRILEVELMALRKEFDTDNEFKESQTTQILIDAHMIATAESSAVHSINVLDDFVTTQQFFSLEHFDLKEDMLIYGKIAERDHAHVVVRMTATTFVLVTFLQHENGSIAMFPFALHVEIINADEPVNFIAFPVMVDAQFCKFDSKAELILTTFAQRVVSFLVIFDSTIAEPTLH